MLAGLSGPMGPTCWKIGGTFGDSACSQWTPQLGGIMHEIGQNLLDHWSCFGSVRFLPGNHCATGFVTPSRFLGPFHWLGQQGP